MKLNDELIYSWRQNDSADWFALGGCYNDARMTVTQSYGGFRWSVWSKGWKSPKISTGKAESATLAKALAEAAWREHIEGGGE